MRKSIVFIISVLLIVLCVGSTFCFTFAEGDETNGKFYDIYGNEETEEQFLSNITQRLLQENPGTTLGAPGQRYNTASATPTQPTAAPTTNATASTPATPKEKLTVYFTDAFGNALGSSQVTKGTTIAESQFVQDVPECDGKTFDHWDYDGRVIEHEYIVRAVYK